MSSFWSLVNSTKTSFYHQSPCGLEGSGHARNATTGPWTFTCDELSGHLKADVTSTWLGISSIPVCCATHCEQSSMTSQFCMPLYRGTWCYLPPGVPLSHPVSSLLPLSSDHQFSWQKNLTCPQQTCRTTDAQCSNWVHFDNEFWPVLCEIQRHFPLEYEPCIFLHVVSTYCVPLLSITHLKTWPKLCRQIWWQALLNWSKVTDHNWVIAWPKWLPMMTQRASTGKEELT